MLKHLTIPQIHLFNFIFELYPNGNDNYLKGNALIRLCFSASKQANDEADFRMTIVVATGILFKVNFDLLL